MNETIYELKDLAVEQAQLAEETRESQFCYICEDNLDGDPTVGIWPTPGYWTPVRATGKLLLVCERCVRRCWVPDCENERAMYQQGISSINVACGTHLAEACQALVNMGVRA